MTEEELRELVRSRLRAGQGRAAIVQVLAGRGLDRERATLLHDRVRSSWQREELPGRLRRSGWRNLWMGFGVCVASVALCAFIVVLARGQLDAQGRVTLKLLLLPGTLVILSAGQLAYAVSRFRLARKAEGGRLTREDMPRSPADE